MWYIVLGLLAAIYLTLNYVLTGGFFEVYIIRPLLWILLAIVTFIIAHSEGLSILKFKKILRWNLGRTPVHAGLLLGGFQVALLIIVGLFFNFGESPYSFALTSIITNIFSL